MKPPRPPIKCVGADEHNDARTVIVKAVLEQLAKLEGHKRVELTRQQNCEIKGQFQLRGPTKLHKTNGNVVFLEKRSNLLGDTISFTVSSTKQKRKLYIYCKIPSTGKFVIYSNKTSAAC